VIETEVSYLISFTLRVARVDGASVLGGKHHNCEYFVLDLDHDPHAIAAIRAYADSCGRNGYELLARGTYWQR